MREKIIEKKVIIENKLIKMPKLFFISVNEMIKTHSFFSQIFSGNTPLISLIYYPVDYISIYDSTRIN